MELGKTFLVKTSRAILAVSNRLTTADISAIIVGHEEYEMWEKTPLENGYFRFDGPDGSYFIWQA